MKPPSLFEPFPLTRLDQANGEVFFHYSVSFEVQDEDKALKTISKGVDHLLALVPFLTGETTRAEGSGAIELRPATASPDGEIPMFQVKRHANCTLPVRKIGKIASSVPQNLPLQGHFNPLPPLHKPGQPSPVIRFQANVLEDGIVLTVGFNHLVFDAMGGAVIITLLAESCRNPRTADGQIAASELLLRKQVSDLVSAIMMNPSPEVVDPPASLEVSKPTSPPPPPPQVQDECLVFSAERLEQMRDACNSVLPWLNSSASKQSPEETLTTVSFLSSNDVLTGLICETIKQARGPDQPSPPPCMMGINARGFFEPPLPQTYMGNAGLPLYFHVQPTIPAQQEPDLSLPHELHSPLISALDTPSFVRIAKTAHTIRSGLSNFPKTYAGSLTAFIKAASSPPQPSGGPNPVIVSSLRPLKTYEMQFGPELGDIQTFETGVPWVDGACVILPLCAGGPEVGRLAPWCVRITLYADVMERFKGDRALSWVLL
jgi:fumigaclavine B O-acetyltransferase